MKTLSFAALIVLLGTLTAVAQSGGNLNPRPDLKSEAGITMKDDPIIIIVPPPFMDLSL